MASPMQFCISNPLIGQLRSNDDVIRSTYISLYNFSMEYFRDMVLVPKCSSHRTSSSRSSQDASNNMRLDLFRSIQDLDLG